MLIWSLLLILAFPIASLGQSKIVDTGAVYMDECTRFNSQCLVTPSENCGTCQYRIMHTTRCTPANPCDNLVVYWEDYGCELEGVSTIYPGYLKAAPDFVIACVQPSYPGEILPTSLGAPERDNTMLAEVFGRLRDKSDLGVWSGKNLLMAGCSIGGSRYPVVAARYTDDNKWIGSVKSAACMSDGVVDVSHQDLFDGIGLDYDFDSCSDGHDRIVNAYTMPLSFEEHSCEDSPSAQCACDPTHLYIPYENDCGNGDCVTFDSVITRNPFAGGAYTFAPGVTAEDFAIKRWRILTEGSEWEFTDKRCDNDRVPREPFRALCNALNTDPGHSCDYLDRPTWEHCAYFDESFVTACLDWFRELPVRGDLDGDDRVTLADRFIIANALGTCLGDAGYIADGDYNGNRCIEKGDYDEWVKIFRGKS